MKNLILMVVVVFMVGCGGGSGGSSEQIVTVEEYNPVNSENRVNIFLSFGQSNAVGITTNEEINTSGVLMPVEGVYEYPEKITFKQFSNNNINKGYYNQRLLINTATKFAEDYNSSIPLIVVNIAVEGIGINTGHRKWDLWNPSRVDDDGNSLHPQTIHYLKTLFTQLQDQGLEPYVLGLDWNQWEAENKNDSAFNYFDTYSKFFDTFLDVIPNKDFKLFLCQPTSLYFSHTSTIKEGFELLANDRQNTYIYRPKDMSVNIWRDSIEAHYTKEVHEGIASFILGNI